MTQTLRVACVGAGYFSRFHYDAWRRIDGVEPVAAVDRDVEKARGTKLPAFAEIGAMLRSVRPDLVDIITPPETHLSAIREAIAAGVRAIICQKPFCRDLGEAEQAVEEAEAAGIPLIVHENFRFQPWYRQIKRELEAGSIGTLHQITFRLRTGDGQGPQAYLDRQPYFQTMPRLLIHETGVHWIDTFRYLMGEPDTVYADLRRMNPVIAGEDAGYFVFGYADGRRALFDGNRLLDHSAENHRMTLGEALVEGTDGSLTLTGDGSVHLRAFGATEVEMRLPPREWPGFAGDCVHAFQSHVVAALKGDAVFETAAKDYLAVLRLERALYASDAAGQRVDV